jgi:hypothetical protein
MAVKLTIQINDIASAAATYNAIQVGRAATSADAAAQTGTFVNAGSVITLNNVVSTYEYNDNNCASNQWSTWRLFNTSTSAAGSWATPFQGQPLGYITVDEFRSYELGDLQGPDGEDISDQKLEKLIKAACGLADSYVGYSFEYVQNKEKHPWNQKNRRVYVRQRPIVSVSEVSVHVSAQQSAKFTLNDYYINEDRGYVEITSLAAVTYSLFPAIVALGMIEPVVEIVYTHGYAVAPQPVKDAVAIIVVDLLSKDNLIKQGMGGLSRYRIGDMEMYSAYPQGERESGQTGGGSLRIPRAAMALLDQYQGTAIR